MGHELYRMIRDGAAPDWTPDMRLVAMVIADDARPDPSQGTSADGGWPRSRIRFRGGRVRGTGEWYDGLAERTGMREYAISRALTALARAGYEMREPIGTDVRGRPVFAYPGRSPSFRVPPLAPRGSTTDTSTYGSTTDTSTSEGRQAPERSTYLSTTGSTTNTASKVDTSVDLQSFKSRSHTVPRSTHMTEPGTGPLPSADRRAAPPPVTAPDRSADDDDSSDQPASLNGQRDGRVDPPGPGYGQCPECKHWHRLGGYGWLVPHRVPGDESQCPGRRPAAPVPCARCRQTGIALAAQSGLCKKCRDATRAEATP
jgi:hypothetical protein